jgi:membrane associated rhomboid family serine protease
MMHSQSEGAGGRYTFSSGIQPRIDFSKIIAKSPVTIILVATHLAIFAVNFYTNQVFMTAREYGFSPIDLLSADRTSLTGGFEVASRLVTYSFFHANPTHVILNAMPLTFFGALIERKIGSLKFIALYLISAMGAAFAHAFVGYFFSADSNTFLIGGSGAIFGVLGFAAARGSRLPLILVSIEPVLSIIIYVYSNQPTGLAAHVGGLLTGYLVAKLAANLNRIVTAGQFNRSKHSSIPSRWFENHPLTSDSYRDAAT